MSITGCGLFCSATAERSFKRCTGIDISELHKAEVTELVVIPVSPQGKKLWTLQLLTLTNQVSVVKFWEL
jgi:hypothetical protein